MADTDRAAQQAEIAARIAQVKRKQQRIQELLELEEEEARLLALQESLSGKSRVTETPNGLPGASARSRGQQFGNTGDATRAHGITPSSITPLKEATNAIDLSTPSPEPQVRIKQELKTDPDVEVVADVDAVPPRRSPLRATPSRGSPPRRSPLQDPPPREYPSLESPPRESSPAEGEESPVRFERPQTRHFLKRNRDSSEDAEEPTQSEDTPTQHQLSTRRGKKQAKREYLRPEATGAYYNAKCTPAQWDGLRLSDQARYSAIHRLEGEEGMVAQSPCRSCAKTGHTCRVWGPNVKISSRQKGSSCSRCRFSRAPCSFHTSLIRGE